MIFGYVGICYKEAPLALRGQVALPDSKKIELWERLSVIGLKQCVIVSTCNRSEIFYFSHSDVFCSGSFYFVDTAQTLQPALCQALHSSFRLGIAVRKKRAVRRFLICSAWRQAWNR